MAQVLFITDLHGSLAHYREAGAAAAGAGVQAIILGGDLCPRPRHQPLAELPRVQARFLREELAPLLAAWRAEGRQVFAIPGNDDFANTLETLDELGAAGLVTSLHGRAVPLGDHVLVGLGFVPPTPFAIKDFERRDEAAGPVAVPPCAGALQWERDAVRPVGDFGAYLAARPSLEEELARLDAAAAPGARLVGVLHTPPSDTRCDVLWSGAHVGSRAVRAWIERRRPVCTLHGHIHESPDVSGAFADRVGATWIVNPGADERQARWVCLDLARPEAMTHSVWGEWHSRPGKNRATRR
jgi:Icc-related predicted phosphoesterase